MDVGAFFKGKKITVMRIGLLGRGVGDTRFLAEQGADILVVDDAPQSVMQPSVDALKHFPNVRFKFGPYDPGDFIHADFILKGAGAPFDEPTITLARKAGVPIKMSASWFAERAHIPFVGITGTRGKSTVTHMLYQIMMDADMHVILGGNIRGISTLALLPEVTKDSIGLFELDSWQCQGFGESKISPDVGVLTTLYSDHMNYYKNDMNAYISDKMQLFANQKPEDTFVVGAQAVPYMELYKNKIHSHVVVAKPQHLKLQIPGAHNQANAACALEAARALGIDDEVSLWGLEKFKGAPGRLELVREVGGIKFYNDTTATMPDATLAALEALRDASGQNQNLILILGGADKGLDMSRLVAELPKVKKVVLLAGTGTDKLLPQLKNFDVMKHHNNLSEAFAAARAGASAGDVILFSPAFASFGMFKNEFDRGDRFVELVDAL